MSGSSSVGALVRRYWKQWLLRPTRIVLEMLRALPTRQPFLHETNRAHYPIYFIQTDTPPSTMVVSLSLLTGFLLFPSRLNK